MNNVQVELRILGNPLESTHRHRNFRLDFENTYPISGSVKPVYVEPP